MKKYEGKEPCPGCGRTGEEVARDGKNVLCYDCAQSLLIGKALVKERNLDRKWYRLDDMIKAEMTWYTIPLNDISKAVYELDEEALTLTVSFYKKEGEEWVWDEYYSWVSNRMQPIFFEPYLVEQEHALRFYLADDPVEHVNQFVFTLAETNEPTYVNAEEHNTLNYSVYPNPSKGELRVMAPTEGAVIRLYNLQGQLVLARPFDFSTEINAEALPSGMYVWEIWHNSQKQASGKWVKE